MTRSDNPFGDLPEWKERQRLQEAQEQLQGVYPPAHDPAYMQQPGHEGVQGGYHQVAPPYQPQPAAPDAQYHQAPPLPDPHAYAAPGQAPLHYDVGTAQNGVPGYDPHSNPQTVPPAPTYDTHGQTQYVDTNGQPTVGYQEPGPAQHYEPPQQPSLDAGGLRGGQYEHGDAYPAGGQLGVPLQAVQQYQATGYDPHQTAFGQHTLGPETGPAYYDPAAQEHSQWAAGGAAGAAAALQPTLGHEAAHDTGYADEDEYDDEYDDDEPQRYSWKLLAAVVVTGAVVAGGGVVLYDSFASGGVSKNGKAPIVRAQRGPAKTAPKDAGGRKFAHQNSKLLGRLDNSGASKTVGPAETDGGNRVRAVPTVRIGRDGRLILPKAPEAAPAPAPQVATNVASAGQSTPGINVVETLSGRGRASGLGGLPPVMPKTNPVAAARAPAVRQPAVPEIKPPALRKSSAPPVIKNRGAANRATVRKPAAPPVPAKSSVGTSWRMTGTATPSTRSSQTARIRPTIARPVNPVPAKTKSTLGAGAVAKAQGRGYVAVLATAPTRMKALQSFAELQQKHPRALVNRVPDVQKADLQKRGLGIMYRVVVGPAGTRSAANSVCSSLKSEGYTGCWVKAN